MLVDLSSIRASLGLECLKSLSLSSFVALIFTASLSALIVNTALSSCVHTHICISSFGPMRVVAWKRTFLHPYMKKDGGGECRVVGWGVLPKARHSTLLSQLCNSQAGRKDRRHPAHKDMNTPPTCHFIRHTVLLQMQIKRRAMP